MSSEPQAEIAPGLGLNHLVADAHGTATQKGWHGRHQALLRFIMTATEDADPDLGVEMTHDANASRIGALVALIQSEASEALEAYRERGLEAWEREDGKPEGFEAELADIVIRIADLCGEFKLDLNSAVMRKLRFNKSRPFRHGNKVL